jgi:hypothetical protein
MSFATHAERRIIADASCAPIQLGSVEPRLQHAEFDQLDRLGTC